MTTFLMLMVFGLVGMVLMALPGLMGHGHGDISHGTNDFHGELLGVHTHSLGDVHSIDATIHHAGDHSGDHLGQDATNDSFNLMRYIPSPRIIFTLLTFYGAFGYGLMGTAHLSASLAAWWAILPAFLLERFAARPIWKALMKLEGIPDSPLESLTFGDAEAVTAFRNGKGMVSVEKDGRTLQLTAQLTENQMLHPVRVGDKLRVEAVDSEHEKVTVSIQ